MGSILKEQAIWYMDYNDCIPNTCWATLKDLESTTTLEFGKYGIPMM